MTEQDTRTAATVIADWFDEHGFGGGVDTDELQSLSAALADAGYVIGQRGRILAEIERGGFVVVDRERVERLMASAEDIWYWWELIMGYEEHKHPEKRTEPPNTCLPSDFDPLPTQEGEPFVLTLEDVTLVPTRESE
jgi:hypothetical protein